MPIWLSYSFISTFLLFYSGIPAAVAASLLPIHAHTTILESYSPIWVQKIGEHPLYDAITRIDFDGNKSGRDNVIHSQTLPIPAWVYADVVAETIDTYYLFYGIYHIKDYDTPVREFFFKSASHDNDFEGAMLAVDKNSGAIRAIETWFHSTFLQFVSSFRITGSQTIDGKIHVENGTHPILYVQSNGHGVRAFQKIDEETFYAMPHQIYRLATHHQKITTDISREHGPFVHYGLLLLSDFVAYARGPFDQSSLFANPQDFGLGPPLGKYLSGPFAGDSSWARPKPPWSWADRFDTLRPGAWFFHPAFVFNQHFAFQGSEKYSYNLSTRNILKVADKDLETWVLTPVLSFFNDVPQGFLHAPAKKVRQFLYRITEYLFYYLG